MNTLATSPNYVSTDHCIKVRWYIDHGKLSITQCLMLRDGRLDIDQLERSVLAREAADMQERLAYGAALLMPSVGDITEAFRLEGLNDQSLVEFNKELQECLKGVACVSMETTTEVGLGQFGLCIFGPRAWMLRTLALRFFRAFW